MAKSNVWKTPAQANPPATGSGKAFGGPLMPGMTAGPVAPPDKLDSKPLDYAASDAELQQLEKKQP